MENYEKIKEQLNDNIAKIANKNKHVLMENSTNEKNTIKCITKGSAFKNAIS